MSQQNVNSQSQGLKVSLFLKPLGGAIAGRPWPMMLFVPASSGWLLPVSDHVLQQSRRQTQNVVVLIREFASTQKLPASSTDGEKGTQTELGVKLRRILSISTKKVVDLV